MTYTTRPLSDRTWLRPASKREGSRFDSTWTKTLQLLDREVGYLQGRDVVIEVDVSETDLRLDGTLRARARAASPAVVVAFDTAKLGPMLYRCDRFVAKWSNQGEDWQQNVRAIALTLEALRSVDRYGATETGQQYTGFKAIGGGAADVNATAMPAGMTRRTAAELLERLVVGDEGDARERSVDIILTGRADMDRVVRDARRAAHPDRNGGAHDLAYAVDQALQVLGLAR